MSDFIASNLHKKVDHIMDVFFGAGVASHPTIIEQINYLLFMRALSQNDDDLRKLGITDKNKLVFDGDLDKYRWENLLALNAEQLFIALEECFRKIPESTTNKTVRLIFRNAHIKLFDKPTLRTVLHEIDSFAKLMDEGEHAGKRDIFGDTYEYLLSKLSQAGTSGQFRTPRHIIEFLVKVIAPKKGETILDPAVGTAGFLVKAFEYLRAEYTSPEHLSSGGTFDKLNSKEHTFLYEHTFSGFDSDEDMIKFGMMNLYLHGLQNARLIRQNTLTDTAGNRDKYDIILANPPFSGKIDRDSVAEELQMNTGATEVLFLRYMIRHLTDSGRAGVIVPEGVLFNGSGAHSKIREMLLENGLWCVVSLPSGVFNPYAGVKTSILFFDKAQKDKERVLFAKVEHDGFSLSAQRKPIKQNDLPEILLDIERFKKGDDLQHLNAHVVSYGRIKESKDFNLSGDRYKLTETAAAHDYPMVELGDSKYFQIESGGTPSSKNSNYWNGNINWVTLVDLPQTNRITEVSITARQITDEGLSNSSAKLLPVGTVLVSSRATIGRVGIARRETATNQGFKNIVIKSEEVVPEYVANVLAQMTDTLKNIASGGTFAEFSKTSFEKIKIPLPPKKTQQRIVEEIENKQKAIDHARGIISTLERERQYFDPSARAQKENWPIVKIGDTFITSSGGTPLKSNNAYYENGTIPWLGSGEVDQGVIESAKNKITDLALKETSVKLFPKGSVLVAMYGATVGKVGILGFESTTNQAVCAILPDKQKVVPEYLYAVLYASKEKLVKLSAGGAQPNISQQTIKNFEIPLPPLEVQKQIANEFAIEQEIVESNKKLIKIYEQKIQQTLAEI